MTYTKTIWKNGEGPALNANNLNKIEQGIEDAYKINFLDLNAKEIDDGPDQYPLGITIFVANAGWNSSKKALITTKKTENGCMQKFEILENGENKKRISNNNQNWDNWKDYYTIGSRKENEDIGENSFSCGVENVASGNYSFAGGRHTVAQGFCQTVFGQYNRIRGLPRENINYGDNALVIGSGMHADDLDNCFRVQFGGQVFGKSSFNSTGADYAEFFEWSDKNKNNEDRIGYFVTLNGNKIKKATKNDDYILGVISANPSVIGDTASECWNNKYLKDDFGRIKCDKNGIYKVNPKWDNKVEYKPREERQEWAIVGMLGKIIVRDDGTCKINGYCKPNNEGIATKSETGYRVLKRINKNIIQILFR